MASMPSVTKACVGSALGASPLDVVTVTVHPALRKEAARRRRVSIDPAGKRREGKAQPWRCAMQMLQISFTAQ
jgi:hypothetical protein